MEYAKNSHHEIKINTQAGITAIEQALAYCEKQLRHNCATKGNLMEGIDALDIEDTYFLKRKEDLDYRLSKIYDKMMKT